MLSAPKILVVEDERVVARDLQKSLTDLGYQVPHTCASGEQAIRLAGDERPDLVLMDIRIQGERDGIETAAVLRERFGVPVVYLSAFADRETIDRAKRTEPYGYLVKPVKEGPLRCAIEIALNLSEAMRHAPARSPENEAATAVGRLSVTIAQDICDPLAVVVADVAYARAELARPASGTGSQETVKAALDDAQTGAQQIRDLVAGIDLLAVPAGRAACTLDAGELLDVCLALVKRRLDAVGRRVEHRGALPPVRVDPTALGQVFIQVLLHAVQSMAVRREWGNELRVVTRTAADGRAIIEVRDTGCGMAPIVVRAIPTGRFPVPTSSAVAGLSVAHDLVASMGGALEIESRDGLGTTVRVVLPASPALPAGAGDVTPAPVGVRGRVLVVADQLLQRTIRRILGDQHEVTTPRTARDALGLLASGFAFDLLLCDLSIADPDAGEVYRAVAERDPGEAARMMFMSGSAHAGGAPDGCPVLRKPFTPEGLREACRDRLEVWGPAGEGRSS